MSAAAIPPETRARIGDLAERLLDAGNAILALLDELDGDPDAEEDDPCGQADEDGINTALPQIVRGPGCPISDPAEGLQAP